MKKQIKKIWIKKCRFEKKENQIWDNKKIKSNYKIWNEKTISIKKIIRTTKNNNQKNKYYILYKNKMLRDEI